MTKLIVSFNRYQSNWYIGELYYLFFNFLKTLPNISIEYKDIKDLSLEYPKSNNKYIDIFSIYNLIIINKDTKKTFIHSLSDYAPTMMEDVSGILNFNVAGFACTSNLSKDLYEKYSKKYKIFPSFYILENYSDLNLIEINRNKQIQKINSCYFNGLCYGHRTKYRDLLSENDTFIFKDKSNTSDYRSKEKYYEELNNYKFGLSLDGAAKICYRDLEYFGLGVLCLREPLQIMTRSPLLPNVHYLEFIDNDIKSILYDVDKSKTISKKLEIKLGEIIKSDYSDILINSRKWYEDNCLPENQIKILYTFLLECGIFY
jgi:hypothetical protein